MALYYLDSSALAKRYIHETGSEWINSLTDSASGDSIFTVRLTVVEIVAAITRRTRERTMYIDSAEKAITSFKHDWQSEYEIVEVTERLADRAVEIAETYGLRGYDSVQLAAACEIQDLSTTLGISPFVFVSADTELNEKAKAEGLAVENPNLYT